MPSKKIVLKSYLTSEEYDQVIHIIQTSKPLCQPTKNIVLFGFRSGMV